MQVATTFTEAEFDLLVRAQAIATQKDTSIEMVLENLLMRLHDSEESALGYAFSDIAEQEAA